MNFEPDEYEQGGSSQDDILDERNSWSEDDYSENPSSKYRIQPKVNFQNLRKFVLSKKPSNNSMLGFAANFQPQTQTSGSRLNSIQNRICKMLRSEPQ